MPDKLYALKVLEPFEDHSDQAGIFTSIEKAKEYAEWDAGHPLEWELEEGFPFSSEALTGYASTVDPGLPLNMYFIDLEQVDPEPWNEDDYSYV
ncbi:hypothetical protein ACFRAQ_34500 [Nocardia sp. NPDC056611]|uniref:hypothetical protein n=1 Tax=Nocardia sp. NPDC056611 TaxID=3345877 RepID=UPI00366CC902